MKSGHLQPGGGFSPPLPDEEAPAMRERLESVLDEHVRPLLRSHGGDLEVIDTADGVLRFRFKGKCSGCPAADLTTEELVQAAICEHIPEFKRAVLIRRVSQELIEQARAMLAHRGP